MAEEHEASQPYKCAVCGAKFDSEVKFPLMTGENFSQG